MNTYRTEVVTALIIFGNGIIIIAIYSLDSRMEYIIITIILLLFSSLMTLRIY